MRFASLILAFAVAIVASAAAVPTKRSYYYLTFVGFSAATEAPGYLTYVLRPSIQECLAACDSVAGCNFVNTYLDVNGKNGSPDFTCAMYTACQYSNTAINAGGQTQPDGKVDFIVVSDGWCKI